MGKKWLLIFLSMVVMIGLLAVPAVAADTLASCVTDDGCPWEISSDYVLYLGEEGKTMELECALVGVQQHSGCGCPRHCGLRGL